MTSNFSIAPGFHAVVIGGAGDIGAAISNQFCDLGATVTATGANETSPARCSSRAPASRWRRWMSPMMRP
jgi:NAD(P)-dependent dehydrogenase (short-subunit alcohol dehydrogenase family)